MKLNYSLDLPGVEGHETGGMIDGFGTQEVRSSGELWSEICSGMPEHTTENQEPSEFRDSFQPQLQEGTQENTVNGIPWKPMDDSEVYIASLENRLRRLKGQSQEVTSREMLRTLSQAKKECWDRFLYGAQGSDLFQEGGEIDESALEQLKRWLQPEKVAISAEELEHLLLPEQSREHLADGGTDRVPTEAKEEDPEAEESQAPEK
ncbi:coiled-coil domain-containing protein 32 [Anguilla rostrata]|uniref:coiled-coil domain-containing protein 32 n=1 Tax=Anguilla rostrata TaxID=7938 RepID=UPI0030D418EB